MARHKVFAIWDNAVGAYEALHTSVTRGAAVREFIDVAGNPQSKLSKHPLDYSLFELGEFDDCTGLVEWNKAPINLGSAASFSAKAEGAVDSGEGVGAAQGPAARAKLAVERHSAKELQ